MKKFVQFLLFFLFLTISTFAEEAFSDWDNSSKGLNDWEKATVNTNMNHNFQNGNLGGHIRTHGNLKIGIKNHQPQFTGNYAEKESNNISLEIKVNNQHLPHFKPIVSLQYSSAFADWNYELKDFIIKTDDWQHFEVSFNPGWSDEEAKSN